MKIVAVIGSPRPGGNTEYLVDQALAEIAAQGIDTEKILLGRYRITPCQGHDDCASLAACRLKDDAPGIIERFRLADGIILGTPVYYYNMSAQMKAFIDRNYFLYTHDIELKAACAGLIAVAGSYGTDQTLRALSRFLSLSAEGGKERILTLAGHAHTIGEIRTNTVLAEEARQLGKRMAEIVKATVCG